MDLIAIHEGLAAQVVEGTARPVHGYPFQTGGNYELPCVVVCPGEEWINYHVDMGDQCDVNLLLEVRAPCRVAVADGLRLLAELLSKSANLPNSVIDAIEADPTIGGVVQHVEVGIPGAWTGFGATGEEGLPQGVLMTVPIQVWDIQS